MTVEEKKTTEEVEQPENYTGLPLLTAERYAVDQDGAMQPLGRQRGVNMVYAFKSSKSSQ